MKLQRLLSLTRQAVDDYALIDSGDKIAVGISGGKDSLTLLYALHGLKRFYPNEFELSAITVDLGFENFDLSPDVYKRQLKCSGIRHPPSPVSTIRPTKPTIRPIRLRG